MNFKKLSVIAFAVASFAAHAGNLIDDMTDYSIATNKDALVGGTVGVSGNAAYILQDGGVSGAVAYISQSGGVAVGNLAAIMQADGQGLAMVYQSGDGNKAVISTKYGTDAGDTGTRTGVDITISKDTETLIATASAELADVPANGLSEVSNVALITQSSDGGFGNTAYIDIVGNNNFAAIAQTAATASNLAVISQLGTFNRAMIVQAN